MVEIDALVHKIYPHIIKISFPKNIFVTKVIMLVKQGLNWKIIAKNWEIWRYLINLDKMFIKTI